MISSFLPSLSAIRVSRVQLFRGLSILTLACTLSGSLLAQADPAAGDRRRRGADGADNGGGRGNFDPAQMQDRMMTALRTQFDVPDDAEWKLIQDRIIAVTEVRRASGGGFGGMMMGGRGGPPGGGGPTAGRTGRTANPESDSLRQAITDKLPDAEIKSRLTRLRESRKNNEEKLARVQEELRAVLSVRQEAIAVMAGLLP
jgi:hypothetical protein